MCSVYVCFVRLNLQNRLDDIKVGARFRIDHWDPVDVLEEYNDDEIIIIISFDVLRT